VSLRRGSNQIRVVAMSPQGPIAEKSVQVQYVPPAPSATIRIIRPADGAVFDSPGQDLIEVDGEVSEPGISLARVVFNEFAIPVTVRDGRFSAMVPAVASEVTIWAEVQGERQSLCSDPITIRRLPYRPRGYVLLHLPTAARKVEARVWLSQRTNTADVNSARKVTSHFPSGGTGSDRTPLLLALPTSQEGAYALALDYRVPPAESVEKGWGLVIVPGPSGNRSLRFGPFQLTGKGRVTLAKFLLPQAIFWDEDSWFTGFAEGADSLTKFRHPDGVSWTERKGDAEFPSAK
jgi:hypothetical protein